MVQDSRNRGRERRILRVLVREVTSLNGKLKIEVIDDNEDGVPDRYIVKFSIGRAALLGTIAMVCGALGYSVV